MSSGNLKNNIKIIRYLNFYNASGTGTIFIILYAYNWFAYCHICGLSQIFMRWNIKLRSSIISRTFSGEVMHWPDIDNTEPFQSARCLGYCPGNAAPQLGPMDFSVQKDFRRTNPDREFSGPAAPASPAREGLSRHWRGFAHF